MPPLLTVIPTPGLVGSEAGFGASLAVQLPSAPQGASFAPATESESELATLHVATTCSCSGPDSFLSTRMSITPLPAHGDVAGSTARLFVAQCLDCMW